MDRDAILARYYSEGFSEASFTWSSNLLEDSKRVELKFVIREGPQLFVRQVLVSGLQTTEPDFLNRNLLLNPQIMVFDEPTSSMDNSTEAAFKQRLGAIARGKTIILVTHRHSMLALVDRLIVLDRGKVVADGPKSGVLEALMGGRVQARE